MCVFVCVLLLMQFTYVINCVHEIEYITTPFHPRLMMSHHLLISFCFPISTQINLAHIYNTFMQYNKCVEEDIYESTYLGVMIYGSIMLFSTDTNCV